MREVEKSRVEWLNSFCDQQADFFNYVGNRDLLLGRSDINNEL